MAERIVKTCLSVVFERLTIKVRAHTNQKERGGKRHSMQILSISEKIDFRTKTVIKVKEGYYIMIKGSI